MDRILKIKYGRGQMAINVDTFFPASRTRIRKLGKIMQMDWDHDCKSDLFRLLMDRMQDINAEYADLSARVGPLRSEWKDAADRLNKQREAVREAPGRAAKEAARKERNRLEDWERERRRVYQAAIKRKKELEDLYKALKENVEVVKKEVM